MFINLGFPIAIFLDLTKSQLRSWKCKVCLKKKDKKENLQKFSVRNAGVGEHVQLYQMLLA